MKVHLVDGTYELFRQHFGRPDPGPYGATRGVLRSVLSLLDDGATHVGVATDHVIESFRNDLWPGYKTSAGMPPELLAQFEPLEDGARRPWASRTGRWWSTRPTTPSARRRPSPMPTRGSSRSIIVTPDKDLGQCVRGTRVVQYDRRNDKWFDEAGVTAKFGVGPASIPDYLALVGDSADGFPGLEGWGAKSTAAVLARYGKLEDIPLSRRPVGRARACAARPSSPTPSPTQQELAYLFRRIATVETDVPVGTVDDWRWAGPTTSFEATCATLGIAACRPWPAARRIADVAELRSAEARSCR